MSVNKNDKRRLDKLLRPKTSAPDWRHRALAATKGTQFGAIITEAMRLNKSLPDDEKTLAAAEINPRFRGRATVTSDGFVMCNFISREGDSHMGALVGEVADVERNTLGLSEHLTLSPDDRKAFYALMRAWIGLDYHTPPGLRLDD